MAYTKSPRPYKREWELEKKRNEKKARATRARARRKMDATSPDKNKNGKADKREGKDIAHKRPLSKGGKNSHGVKVQSKSKNRSFKSCLLYTSPSPRDRQKSRMPSSA